MSGQARQQGFIIVAVLWMLAALGALAAIYTRFALTSAIASNVHEDRLRAEALISAAAELTAFQLTAAGSDSNAQMATAQPRVPQQEMPTHGAFSFRLGQAGATVEYRSEAARIDLNVAPKEMLAGLFRSFGAMPDEATYYADRIVGWRKKADQTGEDEEATAYRVAGIPYKPRQGPFQSSAELWLVLGIPPVLTERALPFLTVYSGRADVDTENAAPEVLAALPNMTPERLGSALQQRSAAAQPEQIQSNPAGADAKLAAGSPTRSFRLNIGLALADGRRVAAELVILVLEDGDEPYRVLSWRDDFDGTS